MQSAAQPVLSATVRSLRRTALIASVVAVGVAGPTLAGGDLLLIPDSGADRVWAFNAADGTLVSNNYFPADGIMKQVIQIVPSGTGTLLMADEQMKSVFEYTSSGTHIRTLASPADGVTNGAYGICVKDGFAYFTTGFNTGTGVGRIVRVTLGGGDPSPTLFCDFTSEGDPRGIVPFGSGFLVGNSTTDDIEFVSATGVVSSVPFADSDGVISFDFPQQIQVLPDGGIMLTGFSDPFGIYFFDSVGQGSGGFTPPQVFLSPRGCFLLDNGNYLYTGGSATGVRRRARRMSTAPARSTRPTLRSCSARGDRAEFHRTAHRPDRVNNASSTASRGA
ncbi:MAG: hypothetical protein LW806_12825 [Planctomycetaceae bacterium]|nr:hypothetical protein [Planctomycetaceae bacterium]